MPLKIYKKGILQPRRKPKKSRGTGIEWTDETWNYFIGCSVVSAGCKYCYAKEDAYVKGFNSKLPQYHGLAKKCNGKYVWTGDLSLNSEAQRDKPLRLKQPSMIFVNSMSDFFHEKAPDEWLIRALKIMAKTPRHQYQILTKRPERILPFLERTGVSFTANVWIGVSVESSDVKHRINTLRQVPAQTRFLSLEPLIGPLGELDLTGIHWVIAGGESGKAGDVRPMKADWVREIRDTCLSTAQNVPFFFKQWGRPENNPLFHEAPPGWSGTEWVEMHDKGDHGGNMLDGVKSEEYPAFHLPELAAA